jgi:CPA1 family monovalent cation:H+ antiporter
MELILGLLAAASVLAGLARYISVPYPIVLVVGGAVLAAVPGVPNVRVPPDVVFLVFLPPLVYSAAFFTSPSELRHDAAPILILAIGLVLATVAAVAAVAHEAAGLPWSEAMVLGAILGATDPVAATSIIRRLGAPQRIATVLEGEALINDGTSLTAFKVALAAVGAHSFSLGHGAAKFILVSVGGTVIGVAIGALSTFVRRRLDDANLEVAIALLTAYAAYIAADRAGTSGILAAVAAGLVAARSSPDLMSPGSRLRSYAFWQVATFLLEALLFLLVGLQLRSVLDGIGGSSAGTLAWQAASVIAVMIVLRVAWMYVIPLAVRAVGRLLPAHRFRRPWREQLVLGWSGMRGALSLAAALSLPLARAHTTLGQDRGTLIFLAFAAIFVTLVLPGLTLAPLIRALGLGQSERLLQQTAEARLHGIDAALRRLDDLARERAAPERSLARVRDIYQSRAAALEQTLSEHESHDAADGVRQEAWLREELLEAQREALRELAADRRAPAEVLREIERDLDLDSTRLGRL